MLRSAVLTAHIAAGTIGLALGLLAMAAPKRRGWHTGVGIGYQAAAAALTSTALALVALEPGRLWWLGLIAVLTEAAALGGWWVRRRHRRGWLAWHIRLMCTSYVSFLTAALVVNFDTPLAWFLPTLVATPLIAITAKRYTPSTGGTRRAAAQP